MMPRQYVSVWMAKALSFDKTPFHPATALSLQLPSPFCHPERSRISYFTALIGATYVVLPKENHMPLTEAATLDRKSGGAEGSAVSFPTLSYFGINAVCPR
jgi:hypothetical protein